MKRSVWLTNGNHGKIGEKEENGEITYSVGGGGIMCFVGLNRVVEFILNARKATERFKAEKWNDQICVLETSLWSLCGN